MSDKSLDHLHAVIERLAGNSFTIKGWAVTVASGFLGFAVKDAKSGIALLGLMPVLIFWAMDSYFLVQERHFRALYNDRLRNPAAPDAAVEGRKTNVSTVIDTAKTPVLAVLYLVLCLCCLAVGFGLFVVR
jgi:hypothetical protein